jgi:hypothetical protein
MDDEEIWNPVLRNREWELLWNHIERTVTQFAFSSVPYIDITLTLQIQRRSPSHTAAITVVAVGNCTSI